MCAVSWVYDHYQEPFTCPRTWPYQPSITVSGVDPSALGREVEEIRKLIAEFREALAVAKRQDELTKQPDCFDPKKATLEERVAEIERRISSASLT
jgi:hypothetical protein